MAGLQMAVRLHMINSMSMRFLDRRDAGRQLAAKLSGYANDPSVLVLGLPRGGVPVAYEVARALHAPLDVFVVRKLGVPGHGELAMGAIASVGVRVLNPDVIDALKISPAGVESVAARELLELERQQRAYRPAYNNSDLPLPELTDSTVIVVDDGLATGSTMRAAIAALRKSNPTKIIVAAPVAAAETAHVLRQYADSVVFLSIPLDFRAVSAWYEDFSQTSDEEVRDLLASASRSAIEPKGVPDVDVSRGPSD
jgi:predicted phosphoribosyltransferase